MKGGLRSRLAVIGGLRKKSDMRGARADNFRAAEESVQWWGCGLRFVIRIELEFH
jgi:hypothetical protein